MCQLKVKINVTNLPLGGGGVMEGGALVKLCVALTAGDCVLKDCGGMGLEYCTEGTVLVGIG